METKWWLDSSTVRASLVAFTAAIVPALRLFGIDIGDGEVKSIVDGICGLITLMSVVWAIIGRFKADKPLTLKK